MVGGRSFLPEEFSPPKEPEVLFEVFWNIPFFCITFISYFSAKIELREKHQKNLIWRDSIDMLSILLSM